MWVLLQSQFVFSVVQKSMINTVTLIACFSVCLTRSICVWFRVEHKLMINTVILQHGLVTQGQDTAWQSQSLSRLNTWPLSSSWNPSAHLALVFGLWRHSPSYAVLTPAISLISGTLMEGGSVLFLPVQVQRTCRVPKLVLSNEPLYSFSLYTVDPKHTRD